MLFVYNIKGTGIGPCIGHKILVGKVKSNDPNVPTTAANKDFLEILEKFPIWQWSQLFKVPAASETQISKEENAFQDEIYSILTPGEGSWIKDENTYFVNTFWENLDLSVCASI